MKRERNAVAGAQLEQLQPGQVALFFDTETTGLPEKHKPPEHPSQPRLVQLAFVLAPIGGLERASASMMIKPQGWSIPEAASKVHGITTELATQFGIPLRTAVSCFCHHLVAADVLIAHNIAFDLTVMKSALCQIDAASSIRGLTQIPLLCTQEATRDIVACPPTPRMLEFGIEGYKSPKLAESYTYYTGQELEGAHDALVDVRACRTVFEALFRGDPGYEQQGALAESAMKG